MIDHTHDAHEQEMVTPGMACMGLLMGVGAILGMWFVAGLLQVFSKMMI